MANKSENIFFALLGDCTASKNENESFDDEVIKCGLEETQKLNEKYNKNIEDYLPKFNFLYRRRKWNSSEKCYLGWERKRGLIYEFNEFILNGTNPFRINTINREKLPEIKYIITLDSDTNLSLGTGIELVGAMSHILNEPVVENNIVKEGHGLLQPRIGIDLESTRTSLFTKIYAGMRRNRFLYKCYIRHISR